MSPGSDSPRGGASDAADTTDATGAPTPMTYREVLRTPWWWYLVAIVVAGILAAEFRVAGLDATIWIPFAAMLPLSAAVVWWIGRSAVEVRDGADGPELHIRGAHLPLRYVSGAVALDARTLRLVVGREGDPAAYVSIRPWVGPGVQVWLDDEDDPTPYWVVSSRHPDRLVEVLRARR